MALNETVYLPKKAIIKTTATGGNIIFGTYELIRIRAIVVKLGPSVPGFSDSATLAIAGMEVGKATYISSKGEFYNLLEYSPLACKDDKGYFIDVPAGISVYCSAASICSAQDFGA